MRLRKRTLSNPKYIFSAIFMLLLFINQGTAQVNGIRLFNEDKNKEIVIKENKRIRVKTSDGQRISGRFTLVDAEHVQIKGSILKLSEIENIKKNPIIVSVLVDGLLMYAGSAMVFLPIIIFPFSGDTGAFYYMITGAAAIYAGRKSPNFLKGYKKSRGWEYNFIKGVKPNQNLVETIKHKPKNNYK